MVDSNFQCDMSYATAETTEDDITFYVSYESSGTTATDATFTEGETLESDTPNKYTANVGVTTISKPLTSNAMGQGSLFTVKEGYYFIDGSSVRNSEQTITLDKYNTKPSYSGTHTVIQAGHVVPATIGVTVDLTEGKLIGLSIIDPGAYYSEGFMLLSLKTTKNSLLFKLPFLQT